MTKTFGQWFAEELKLRDIKQVDFAEMVGEPRQNVNQWVKDRAEPRREIYEKIATIFCCTIDDMKERRPTAGDVQQLPREDRYFFVPHLDIGRTCDAGFARHDVGEDAEPFRIKDLSQYDAPQMLFVTRMLDSSMEPKIVKGDRLLLNAEVKAILTTGIYALVVNGRFVIGNINVSLLGDVSLEPLNKDYPSVTLSRTALSEISVVGLIEAKGWTQLK